MKCILGIDTSNYTTSMCAVDAANGELLASARMMLPVTKGERGLRQSDALFFHVQQLPLVMDDLMRQLHQKRVQPAWVCCGVSVRPRPMASSYMPVFTAGLGFAHAFAQALGIPVVRTSHQEGHLAAAEYFVPVTQEAFVGVHISGGTSDVMVALHTDWGYKIDLVGEGLDLHAGQFVDRVGVLLGLPFPSGPSLEALASGDAPSILEIPSAVRGAKMSFSGPFTAVKRAIESDASPVAVAKAVQDCIASAVAKAVEFTIRSHPSQTREVLVAGGVASNQAIRERVTSRLNKRVRGVHVQFAPSEYARDNALGVARIAYLRTC